jgi:hypothetical protein
MRDERRAARLRTNAERERWVRERAKHIGVNASVLFPAPKTVFPEQEDDYEEEEEEEPTDEMEETEIVS